MLKRNLLVKQQDAKVSVTTLGVGAPKSYRIIEPQKVLGWKGSPEVI